MAHPHHRIVRELDAQPLGDLLWRPPQLEPLGDLAGQPRVEDLRAAGWRVDDPSETDGGGRRLRAAKSFASPAGAGPVVEELTGVGGPLRQFRLTQTRSFFKTRTALVGLVDLSTGVDGLADPGLRQQLAAAGVDAPTLERQLGVRLADVFRFEVEARLPGRSRTWTPRLGETVEVEASVEAWNTTRITAGVVALASALALVVVLVRRSRFVTWG